MYERQNISGSSSERDEALAQVLATGVSEQLIEEQRLLDGLLTTGFTQNEATRLLYQRVHLYENSEIRQRVQDDRRIQFARWLYEHGEISS